jgi:hypothetical protein
VVNGWAEPISIDVGVPSLGCVVAWPIVDGNHRLAAAIFRGDRAITAEISGEMRFAHTVFGRFSMCASKGARRRSR